jgi:hypothetical protein
MSMDPAARQPCSDANFLDLPSREELCHYVMFVRFRRQRRRLQASLMQTRRVGGKVQSKHIGALGSVDADASVRSRLAFWAKLPQRLAALGNRLGADDEPKIRGALHSRIPMVTPHEQRAVQAENFKDDERFWDTLRDLTASHIEGHKAQIALAEAKVAEMEPEVAKAAEKAEVARSRLEKLQRGEYVAGGLGKRPDLRALTKAAGLTPSMVRRAELFASLTEAEFEALLAPEQMKRRTDAEDKAFDREARRLIRARK